MAGLKDENGRKKSPGLTFRCIVSCISGIITQFSLLFIPYFFPQFSLLLQFLLSAAVLAIAIGLCQFIKLLLRIHASAPVFVFFHTIFFWVVYISVISQAVSILSNVVFNAELAILLIGFLRILSSDPGFVCHDSPSSVEGSNSEDGHHLEEVSSTTRSTSLHNSSDMTSLSSRRTRYCRICKAYVIGFDHHCPAFGNCIGQRNLRLFMSLLIIFIIIEAYYTMLSHQWINRNLILTERASKIQYSLVLSTMNFSLLQVLWQVAFFAWHVYCVCFNIRTEEWINWRRYPEFHVIVQPMPDTRFKNPYDKGLFCNLKEFLLS
ncbi:probable palmitoyltransferase ZDHHC12 isoform X2 [Chenopodium quinoa]|uniref:probable palmitoyltransferase ZDHHC12 isoform X2 n=1 Tax=Chenopodium quinoa TaxID=63459 RepID=UPI000B78B5E0|nr:probable palmitoyltransferase ZDHHC12 isoform X2 [Chenopodium quinoa]